MLENTFPGNFHSALKKGFLYSPLPPSRNSFKNKTNKKMNWLTRHQNDNYT